MRGPERLETRRLLLRRPGPDDAETIFERYASDPEVVRYLGWPRHRSLEDTRAFLAQSEAEWARSPVGPYLILAREEGTLLGGTGLTFEAPEHAFVGYVLARDAWGRGYAPEAVGAMADVARELGLPRLHALCHPEHRASIRVLERSGFAHEGTFRERLEFPNLAPGERVAVLAFARRLGS